MALYDCFFFWQYDIVVSSAMSKYSLKVFSTYFLNPCLLSSTIAWNGSENGGLKKVDELYAKDFLEGNKNYLLNK